MGIASFGALVERDNMNDDGLDPRGSPPLPNALREIVE